MLALKRSAPAYDQRHKKAGAAYANPVTRIANISHLSKIAKSMFESFARGWSQVIPLKIKH